MPAAKTTEDTRSLNARLLAVQTALVAPKNRRNNFGNYNYRNAEDILEAVKPLLAEHGLTLTIKDEIEAVTPDRVYVKSTCTICMDSEGPWITASAYAREDFDRKGMDGSQITGSASSYSRKYALNGLFLIDDGRDSDDIAASAPAAPAPRQQQAPAPPAQQQPTQGRQATRPANPTEPTREQWAKLAAIQAEMGITDRAEIRGIAANLFGKDEYLESMKTMTRGEVSTLIDNLEYDLHPPDVDQETGEIRDEPPF